MKLAEMKARIEEMLPRRTKLEKDVEDLREWEERQKAEKARETRSEFSPERFHLRKDPIARSGRERLPSEFYN